MILPRASTHLNPAPTYITPASVTDGLRVNQILCHIKLFICTYSRHYVTERWSGHPASKIPTRRLECHIVTFHHISESLKCFMRSSLARFQLMMYLLPF